MSFTGRSAIVTGGASGMGEATARALGMQGAKVLIVDQNAVGAKAVAADAMLAPPVIGDIADSAFCDHCVEAAVTQFGCLDILVNAAGIIHRADAIGTSDADWQRVLNVNVNGLFYMSRAAVRVMRQAQSGAIVNFGSIWGDVGAAGVIAYCASKGAVHQITRAMALETATDGIRVNAVCPGEVDTPMLSYGREHRPSAEELQALADQTIPMKRLAAPEEIAEVVVFLCSAKASYMTGAMVPVDAGYTSR